MIAKEAFKGLAKALRPHIEDRSKPSTKVKENIDGFDNLLVVSRLIFSSVGSGLRAFCMVWVS